MAARHAESRLGFLDSLAGVFHRKANHESAAETDAGGADPVRTDFERLRTEFEAAITSLEQKAAEFRPRAASGTGSWLGGGQTAEERAAAEARRMEAAHRAILEDIRSAHARLKTGLEKADLESLAAYLDEVAAQAEAGRDSHELLPRARFAITEKFQKEAGELAVARIVELLERAGLRWPDPTGHLHATQPGEIERSRRRRLSETRKAFLAQSLTRTAERLLGVVEVWGSDYPDRGSPIWEETVFEAVAAGLRGRIVKESFEVLRRDRGQVLEQTEASIGKELTALRQVLSAGVTSLEEANRAVASSLRALDAVVPEIAWKHVQSQLPAARGEWDD